MRHLLASDGVAESNGADRLRKALTDQLHEEERNGIGSKGASKRKLSALLLGKTHHGEGEPQETVCHLGCNYKDMPAFQRARRILMWNSAS